MEFKDVLKELRKKNNISQYKLADLLYISRSVVAKWESGLSFPNDEMKLKLCELLHVSADVLFPQASKELIIKKNRKLFISKIMIGLSLSLMVILIIFAIVLIGEKNNEKEIFIPSISLSGNKDYLAKEKYSYIENGKVIVVSHPKMLSNNEMKEFNNHLVYSNEFILETSDEMKNVSGYAYYCNEDLSYSEPFDSGWFVENVITHEVIIKNNVVKVEKSEFFYTVLVIECDYIEYTISYFYLIKN